MVSFFIILFFVLVSILVVVVFVFLFIVCTYYCLIFVVTSRRVAMRGAEGGLLRPPLADEMTTKLSSEAASN